MAHERVRTHVDHFWPRSVWIRAVGSANLLTRCTQMEMKYPMQGRREGQSPFPPSSALLSSASGGFLPASRDACSASPRLGVMRGFLGA
jgi:hypothetical protein